MKRWVIRGVLILVALVVVGGAGAWGYIEALKHNWIAYNEYDTRSDGILRVGDPAPDLALQPVAGAEPVRISSLYSQHPLVLVFGSYT